MPRRLRQAIQGGAERNERLRAATVLPAGRELVELRPQRPAEEAPGTRPCDDGARGDAGEPPAQFVEPFRQAADSRTS
jgi:hypothetical protein